MTRPFASVEVAAAFAALPLEARENLLQLRALIFEVADDLPAIGRIEEALRWGQPAYLTPDAKAGSTIWLGVPKSGAFALFVHCQTRLIGDYITMFPGRDRIDPLRHRWLIRRALTCHLKS